MTYLSVSRLNSPDYVARVIVATTTRRSILRLIMTQLEDKVGHLYTPIRLLFLLLLLLLLLAGWLLGSSGEQCTYALTDGSRTRRLHHPDKSMQDLAVIGRRADKIKKIVRSRSVCLTIGLIPIPDGPDDLSRGEAETGLAVSGIRSLALLFLAVTTPSVHSALLDQPPP